LGKLDLDECVSCGAGLLSVSDICPQCGFLKSKGDDLIEAQEKAANENDLDESEEKPNNVVIENYEEFVDKVADDIKNPSRKKSTKIKISRPAGIRLISIFYMAFGVSLTVFAMIFASVVMFMLMSSGFSSLGDIGDMEDIIMLPGMGGIDSSTMESFDMIIGLNSIAGSPSASEIDERMNSAGIMNMDVMMEIMGEIAVIAIIEIIIGLVVFGIGLVLFKGKKWARPAIIAFSIISVPLVVLFVENPDNLILLGIIAFDGMVIYYMFKSKVREYFNQSSIKKPKSKNSRIVKKSQK